MQWAAHDNTEPMNVWAIPTDFLQPLVALVSLVLCRRTSRAATGPPPAPAWN